MSLEYLSSDCVHHSTGTADPTIKEQSAVGSAVATKTSSLAIPTVMPSKFLSTVVKNYTTSYSFPDIVVSGFLGSAVKSYTTSVANGIVTTLRRLFATVFNYTTSFVFPSITFLIRYKSTVATKTSSLAIPSVFNIISSALNQTSDVSLFLSTRPEMERNTNVPASFRGSKEYTARPPITNFVDISGMQVMVYAYEGRTIAATAFISLNFIVGSEPKTQLRLGLGGVAGIPTGVFVPTAAGFWSPTVAVVPNATGWQLLRWQIKGIGWWPGHVLRIKGNTVIYRSLADMYSVVVSYATSYSVPTVQDVLYLTAPSNKNFVNLAIYLETRMETRHTQKSSVSSRLSSIQPIYFSKSNVSRTSMGGFYAFMRISTILLSNKSSASYDISLSTSLAFSIRQTSSASPRLFSIDHPRLSVANKTVLQLSPTWFLRREAIVVSYTTSVCLPFVEDMRRFLETSFNQKTSSVCRLDFRMKTEVISYTDSFCFPTVDEEVWKLSYVDIVSYTTSVCLPFVIPRLWVDLEVAATQRSSSSNRVTQTLVTTILSYTSSYGASTVEATISSSTDQENSASFDISLVTPIEVSCSNLSSTSVRLTSKVNLSTDMLFRSYTNIILRRTVHISSSVESFTTSYSSPSVEVMKLAMSIDVSEKSSSQIETLFILTNLKTEVISFTDSFSAPTVEDMKMVISGNFLNTSSVYLDLSTVGGFRASIDSYTFSVAIPTQTIYGNRISCLLAQESSTTLSVVSKSTPSINVSNTSFIEQTLSYRHIQLESLALQRSSAFLNMKKLDFVEFESSFVQDQSTASHITLAPASTKCEIVSFTTSFADPTIIVIAHVVSVDLDQTSNTSYFLTPFIDEHVELDAVNKTSFVSDIYLSVRMSAYQELTVESFASVHPRIGFSLDVSQSTEVSASLYPVSNLSLALYQKSASYFFIAVETPVQCSLEGYSGVDVNARLDIITMRTEVVHTSSLESDIFARRRDYVSFDITQETSAVQSLEYNFDIELSSIQSTSGSYDLFATYGLFSTTEFTVSASASYSYHFKRKVWSRTLGHSSVQATFHLFETLDILADLSGSSSVEVNLRENVVFLSTDFYHLSSSSSTIILAQEDMYSELYGNSSVDVSYTYKRVAHCGLDLIQTQNVFALLIPDETELLLMYQLNNTSYVLYSIERIESLLYQESNVSLSLTSRKGIALFAQQVSSFSASFSLPEDLAFDFYQETEACFIQNHKESISQDVANISSFSADLVSKQYDDINVNNVSSTTFDLYPKGYLEVSCSNETSSYEYLRYNNNFSFNSKSMSSCNIDLSISFHASIDLSSKTGAELDLTSIMALTSSWHETTSVQITMIKPVKLALYKKEETSCELTLTVNVTPTFGFVYDNKSLVSLNIEAMGLPEMFSFSDGKSGVSVEYTIVPSTSSTLEFTCVAEASCFIFNPYISFIGTGASALDVSYHVDKGIMASRVRLLQHSSASLLYLTARTDFALLQETVSSSTFLLNTVTALSLDAVNLSSSAIIEGYTVYLSVDLEERSALSSSMHTSETVCLDVCHKSTILIYLDMNISLGLDAVNESSVLCHVDRDGYTEVDLFSSNVSSFSNSLYVSKTISLSVNNLSEAELDLYIAPEPMMMASFEAFSAVEANFTVYPGGVSVYFNEGGNSSVDVAFSALHLFLAETSGKSQVTVSYYLPSFVESITKLTVVSTATWRSSGFISLLKQHTSINLNLSFSSIGKGGRLEVSPIDVVLEAEATALCIDIEKAPICFSVEDSTALTCVESSQDGLMLVQEDSCLLVDNGAGCLVVEDVSLDKTSEVEESCDIIEGEEICVDINKIDPCKDVSQYDICVFDVPDRTWNGVAPLDDKWTDFPCTVAWEVVLGLKK